MYLCSNVMGDHGNCLKKWRRNSFAFWTKNRQFIAFSKYHQTDLPPPMDVIISRHLPNFNVRYIQLFSQTGIAFGSILPSKAKLLRPEVLWFESCWVFYCEIWLFESQIMWLISPNVMQVWIKVLHNLGKDLGCKLAIFEIIGNYLGKVNSTEFEIIFFSKSWSWIELKIRG